MCKDVIEAKKKNTHVRDVTSTPFNSLFVYMKGVCHDRNVRAMIEPKKTLKTRLDIRSNVRVISVHFPVRMYLDN